MPKRIKQLTPDQFRDILDENDDIHHALVEMNVMITRKLNDVIVKMEKIEAMAGAIQSIEDLTKGGGKKKKGIKGLEEYGIGMGFGGLVEDEEDEITEVPQGMIDALDNLREMMVEHPEDFLKVLNEAKEDGRIDSDAIERYMKRKKRKGGSKKGE